MPMAGGTSEFIMSRKIPMARTLELVCIFLRTKANIGAFISSETNLLLTYMANLPCGLNGAVFSLTERFCDGVTGDSEDI